VKGRNLLLHYPPEACSSLQHVYKLGLAGNPTCIMFLGCDETAVRLLCYCKAHAEFIHHHSGAHSLNPSDYH
jgi:hypothetical protein